MSPTAVRLARREDLPDLRRMFSRHHGREWSEAATERALAGFDEHRTLTWVATVDGAVVGMTAMELRTLAAGDATCRAGYWTNLFVDPEHREHLFYPRLPMAMFAAARERRLDLVYGCLRRLELLEAHRRIGFVPVGTIPLRLDPIRPTRLLAKRNGQALLERLAQFPDAAFGALRALTRRESGRFELRDDAWSREAAASFADLQRSGARDPRWSADRDPDALFERYRETPEQGEYRVAWGLQGESPVAAIVWRTAERPPAIRSGVLMDLACSPGGEACIPPLLHHVHGAAAREGCEIVLTMDGWGPGVSRLLERSGYWPAPERYELIVWPRAALDARPGMKTPDGWRLSFGDHDAF